MQGSEHRGEHHRKGSPDITRAQLILPRKGHISRLTCPARYLDKTINFHYYFSVINEKNASRTHRGMLHDLHGGIMGSAWRKVAVLETLLHTYFVSSVIERSCD